MLRRLALIVFIAFPVLAQSNPLRQALAEGAKSIAWSIPTEGVSICCCGDNGFNINRDDRLRIERTNVTVVAYFDALRLTKVRMIEPDCPVRTDRVVNATAEQSLDFLLEHLRENEQAITVIATIDHPRVVPELITLARNDRSTKVRKNALFWLGQRAGEKAAEELRRAVDEDPEDEVREQAVFAISQLPAERSVPILIDLVKHHQRPAVRKRAMFWLTQTGDPRALDLIQEILGVH